MINRANQNWPEGFEIISSYSRAEAIEDGVLVDMETEDFQRARTGLGILWPVAMTAPAFGGCVELSDAAKSLGDELFGRYWDVCFALRCAIARAKAAGESGDLLEFSVCCIQRDRFAEEFKLKAVFGPADDASPCITIMLPAED